MNFAREIVRDLLDLMVVYGTVWLILRSRRQRFLWRRTLRDFADRLEVTRTRPGAVLAYFALLIALAVVGAAVLN
jgi:hypothetical protein